jgi:hypothetical protein
VAAPDQQPPATQAAPSAEPPTSAPGDRQAPEAAPDGVGDMDKGNRRGSRGDAPAGSADDKVGHPNSSSVCAVALQLRVRGRKRCVRRPRPA